MILECKWGPLGLKSLLVGERCYEVIEVAIRHSKAHIVWEAEFVRNRQVQLRG